MSKAASTTSRGSRGATAEKAMEPLQIGQRLVELCKQGKNLDAVEEFYDEDVVSVEAQAPEGMPATTRGIAAVRGKHDWWTKNHEVHGGDARGPFVNGERFAVLFHHDVTPKIGAAKGKRSTMDEIALYTVRDGKIVHEAFFF